MKLIPLLVCMAVLLSGCALPSRQHIEEVQGKLYDYRNFDIGDLSVLSLFGPEGEHIFTAAAPKVQPTDNLSSAALKTIVPAASALGLIK